MAHRKTGAKLRRDSPEPRQWDGLTKSLNPFAIGVDPGINVEVSPPEMHCEAQVSGANPPNDPRGRYRGGVPKGRKRKGKR